MIDMNKTYRTRGGHAVRILCVDRKHETHPVVGLVKHTKTEEVVCSFTEDGRYIGDCLEQPFDLIEVSPYDDFKIDETVLTRHSPDEPWIRGYFAGVSPFGRPMTWPGGATSWSANKLQERQFWDECRRPTPEELLGESA